MSALQVVLFTLPFLAGAFLVAALLAARRRRERRFRAFEARWGSRARSVAACRVWRAGERRRGMVAAAPDRIAFTTEQSAEDVEVPAGALRDAQVRRTASGRTVVDLRLAGERILLEVPPGFVESLAGALRR